MADETTPSADSSTEVTDMPSGTAKDAQGRIVNDVSQHGFDKQNRVLSLLTYWGLVAFLLAYTGVIAGGFAVQFGLIGEADYPCPLCMIQRYGMMLATMGALFILIEARRGYLTPARYAQGLGMAVIGSVIGAAGSIRQVLLHIQPGDEGYGEPILGLHLYTWALITFMIVIIYCGIALILAPRAIPLLPPKGGVRWKITTICMWLFLFIIAANLVMIIFLEGFAWVLPDNPTGYNLIDQLTGK